MNLPPGNQTNRESVVGLAPDEGNYHIGISLHSSRVRQEIKMSLATFKIYLCI